jgi:large subunit ribosomal protein L3
MKFIIAKKLEMSQRFKENGAVVPVTLLAAGPCVVTQIRTKEQDGYDAVQVGMGEEKNPNKPAKGHAKGTDGKVFKEVMEFRLDGPTDMKVGDVINAETFNAGEFVDVQGTSKGKGFQGVVKRHHFRGGPKSHGQKDQLRMPGSIGGGGRNGKGRVVKGMRMGGRMGGDTVTVKNLEVVEVDAAKGVIAVKGAVPGAFGAILSLNGGYADKKSW